MVLESAGSSVATADLLFAISNLFQEEKNFVVSNNKKPFDVPESPFNINWDEMMADFNESQMRMTVDQLNKTYHLELKMLKKSAFLREIYENVTLGIVGLGILGNCLGLAVFLLSRRLRTTHLLFFKVIACADLAYCLNFVSVKFVDMNFLLNLDKLTPYQAQFLMAAGVGENFLFTNSFAAHYEAIVSRLIVSVSGYLVLYLSIFISFDRIFALWYSKLYQRLSNRFRRKITVLCIAVGIFLSVVAHSWMNPVERIIDRIEFPFNQNRTGPLYFWENRAEPAWFLRLITISSVVNGVVRVCYPIILLVLTVFVIWGFIRYQKRKRILQQNRQTSDCRN